MFVYSINTTMNILRKILFNKQKIYNITFIIFAIGILLTIITLFILYISGGCLYTLCYKSYGYGNCKSFEYNFASINKTNEDKTITLYYPVVFLNCDNIISCSLNIKNYFYDIESAIKFGEFIYTETYSSSYYYYHYKYDNCLVRNPTNYISILLGFGISFMFIGFIVKLINLSTKKLYSSQPLLEI